MYAPYSFPSGASHYLLFLFPSLPPSHLNPCALSFYNPVGERHMHDEEVKLFQYWWGGPECSPRSQFQEVTGEIAIEPDCLQMFFVLS